METIYLIANVLIILLIVAVVLFLGNAVYLVFMKDWIAKREIGYDGYEAPCRVKDALVVYKEVNGKKCYGVMKGGKLVVPMIYEYVSCYERYTIVQYDGYWGALDKEYKLIVPCVYRDINGESGCFIVEKKVSKRKSLMGLLEANGKELLPCVYDHIEKNIRGYTIEKYGKKGNYIPNYVNFCDNIPIVGKDAYLPIKYDNFEYALTGLMLVSYDGRYGITDLHGKEIIPVSYNCITRLSFEGSILRCFRGKKFYDYYQVADTTYILKS